MKISKKWLSQYMDLSDMSIEEIADKITSAGLEVEGIEKMSQGSNLVIGKVISCEDHPDSDHLHVCQVDLGDKIEQIVCGAPNVTAGQKVIVARVGAKLLGGDIKAGVIRGQESNGMICSLLELGVDPHQLSEESKNGIEVLDEDAPVGNENPLGYLALDDEILDVGLTPNRNDCMAAWSMALETGAILHKEVNIPYVEGASNVGEASRLIVRSETEKCPLFLGKVINSVTIKPSPKWMQELLMAAGMKSINNVVDISNIVAGNRGGAFLILMLFRHRNRSEIRRFDYTLDGSYHIEEDDIVITTEGKPIGIAGIMGGDDSKIEETTKGIIIEAAIFHHVSIRNTSRRLNLGTDASVRYQKGIEPMATFKAVDRAVQLLIEYADASGLEETKQYGSNGYTPLEFDVNLDRINVLLGTDFQQEEVMKVLDDLHLEPSVNNSDIHVKIPSYRMDLAIEADIAEEIIRILGYERLPSTMPKMPSTVGA
ncbi:MAG: phenylalanine--tRNA ligase subunit beta, partial [[Clostridium] innocuum]